MVFKRIIKTHDSELRGQEEAAIIRETKITRPLSELFTRKTAKKIANTLAKLQKMLSLRYYRPNTFLLYRINKPTIAEIGTTIHKYQPMQV